MSMVILFIYCKVPRSWNVTAQTLTQRWAFGYIPVWGALLLRCNPSSLFFLGLRLPDGAQSQGPLVLFLSEPDQ